MSSSFRKTLSRLSPVSSSSSRRKEEERRDFEREVADRKRMQQLKHKEEENAIMQEVCTDIGGKLAGTVNMMEALQDEIELRTAQSERDRERIRSLEGALEQSGKANLLREKDELARRIQTLQVKSQEQELELELSREHSQGKDSDAFYHKSKAESLSQALELRDTGSDGRGASQAEELLRKVTAEKELLTQRLCEVEEKLLQMNIECQALRTELAGQRDVCKKFESETKAIQEDLAAVQEELRLSTLGGNDFLREASEYKQKLKERSEALDKATEEQVKYAEKRALESEQKSEELEDALEKQASHLGKLKQGLSEKERTISLLKDNISDLEASLQDMSKSSTTLAEALENKDSEIQGLKDQVELLSKQLIEEQSSSRTSSQFIVPDKGYSDNLAEIERLAFEREDQLADYAASLQSQQLSEASVKAYLKEVKSDRDNLQFRLQEANTILQETRIQLKALDAETDKLRQSLASSKKLQTEQNKLIHELKETVASYHERMKESDARVELMQVEMQGLTELADALNSQVVEKSSSLDRAKCEVEKMKEEIKERNSERVELRDTVVALEQNARAQKDDLEKKSSELLSAEQMISFLEVETDNLREQLMISETNTSDSDSVAKDLKTKIAHLEEERDALYAELEEAEQMAIEEASFTKENIEAVQLYSQKLEDMQSQVNHLQEEADALRSQVTSYKVALDAKKTPIKGSSGQPDHSARSNFHEITCDLSDSRALNDVTIAMKEMLENKIHALESHIKELQNSKEAIENDKSECLLKIDGIIEDKESDINVHMSLEAKIHHKISTLKEDYLQLKTMFDEAKAGNTGSSSPSLSDLRNINRDIDNLTQENDHLRDELYQKEKRYSEVAEKNIELLNRISDLESAETVAKEKLGKLKKRSKNMEEQSDSTIEMLKNSKLELEEKLESESQRNLTLSEAKSKLTKELSNQKDRSEGLENEKRRLLEKVSELEKHFSEQAQKSSNQEDKEYEKLLDESQSALAQVKAQLRKSSDDQSTFVATLKGEYQELEDSMISMKQESYKLMGEMMFNFERVLQEAKQDCLSVSNEMVEVISEAKSLRTLSAFSSSIPKTNAPFYHSSKKGGHFGRNSDVTMELDAQNRNFNSQVVDGNYICYDENTPLRTPAAMVPNKSTPYTRIENILLNRTRTGDRNSVLKEITSNEASTLTDDLMEKIELAVSKQVSDLGLNMVAKQFEEALTRLETANDHSKTEMQNTSSKRRNARKKSRDTRPSHTGQKFTKHSAYPHPSQNEDCIGGRGGQSEGICLSDMEKLQILQDRLSRIEEKYKTYVESDKLNEGGRRSRSEAVANKLSHQLQSVRSLESKLKASSATYAHLNQASDQYFSSHERQTMDKLLSSSLLEQELKRKQKLPSKPRYNMHYQAYRKQMDSAYDYPPNFNAHEFFGKRIFAVDSQCENKDRLERLGSEMKKFQGELLNGESDLDDLALRARQLINFSSQNSFTSTFV